MDGLALLLKGTLSRMTILLLNQKAKLLLEILLILFLLQNILVGCQLFSYQLVLYIKLLRSLLVDDARIEKEIVSIAVDIHAMLKLLNVLELVVLGDSAHRQIRVQLELVEHHLIHDIVVA